MRSTRQCRRARPSLDVLLRTPHVPETALDPTAAEHTLSSALLEVYGRLIGAGRRSARAQARHNSDDRSRLAAQQPGVRALGATVGSGPSDAAAHDRIRGPRGASPAIEAAPPGLVVGRHSVGRFPAGVRKRGVRGQRLAREMPAPQGSACGSGEPPVAGQAGSVTARSVTPPRQPKPPGAPSATPRRGPEASPGEHRRTFIASAAASVCMTS